MIALLSLLYAVADFPRLDTTVEREYYVVADLTPAEARRLEGQQAGFLVSLYSL
jgi:hypothetical protein